MNIVIMGAGTVGTFVADTLCAEQHNVTIIDKSRSALEQVEERVDVQTICGSACDSAILFQAGVLGADLCLAVTSLDEVNMVGASLAKAMGARRCVARVFNHAYLNLSTFDYQRHFNIDRLLSLEHLTALELAKQIGGPGLFAVENFARGEVVIQVLEVQPGVTADGVLLRNLKLPSGVRVGLISDGENTFIAGADNTIKSGQIVTLIGTQENFDKVHRLFQHKRAVKFHVIIAGGGNIGFNLARILQRKEFSVTILESDPNRCEFLSRHLDAVTVLHADGTRRTEMEEARVGKSDVFVAATGRDEDNIVCGVEARELGANRIMSIVRRPDYANVLEKLGIDVAVSPREVITRQIMGMVQSGPIVSHSEIGGGNSAILELEVKPNAPITQAPLKDLKLKQALIAALVKEDCVRVPGADDQIQEGDTVILLCEQDNLNDIIPLFKPQI
ncbi:MAG: Trk system potassium transporter TrkA [Gimesia sp.]